MAIADRVDEALVKLEGSDLENATIQLAIAIDATGKRRDAASKSGDRSQAFIRENESFIFHMMMEGRLKIVARNGVSFGEKGDLAQVLYKTIRCALLHEADLFKVAVFQTGPVMGNQDGKFVVTNNLLCGLLLAIVADPTNSGEQMKRHHVVQCYGEALPINALWGDRRRIERLVRYVS